MYYRSVNRGISFTKSGWYAVMFVLGVGMVAVNTGSNGMFMFLSLGLALIVVSGLLSESTVQHGAVRQFGSQSVVAGQPFQLTIYAINGHRHVSLYGLEFEVHRVQPSYRFLRDTKDAVGTGSILTLGPDLTKPCVCDCSGIPRGRYSELVLVVKTNFPFGFINKFKSATVSGLLVSAPAVDEELFQTLNREFRTECLQFSDDVEFHSHVTYQSTMNSKHIDWKKSAGRPPHLWVVKDYRSNQSDFSLLIRTDWTLIRLSGTEGEYEKHLSAIRTACALGERYERSCFLQTISENYISGAASIVAYVASLPPFSRRHEMKGPDFKDIETVREVPGKPVVIEIAAGSHQWGGVRNVNL